MSISVLILAIIAFLCFGYGGCILAAASGTRFWMIWFIIGMAFLILALLIKTEAFSHIPQTLKMIFGLLIVAGAAVFLFFLVCILKDFRAEADEAPDYLIVLGAQVRSTGPSLVLKHRLDTACSYLEENPDVICIVSGGQGYNEPQTEGMAMKNYLEAAGIHPSRIISEERSANTMENLQFSSVFLDKEKDRVGIITNNFHMYRAIHTALRCGYRNVSGISAPSSPFYLPNNVLREILGLCKFFLGAIL